MLRKYLAACNTFNSPQNNASADDGIACDKYGKLQPTLKFENHTDCEYNAANHKFYDLLLVVFFALVIIVVVICFFCLLLDSALPENNLNSRLNIFYDALNLLVQLGNVDAGAGFQCKLR